MQNGSQISGMRKCVSIHVDADTHTHTWTHRWQRDGETAALSKQLKEQKCAHKGRMHLALVIHTRMHALTCVHKPKDSTTCLQIHCHTINRLTTNSCFVHLHIRVGQYTCTCMHMLPSGHSRPFRKHQQHQPGMLIETNSSQFLHL